MGIQKLKSKDLRSINFRSDKLKSLSLNITAQHFKYHTKQEKLDLLVAISMHPEEYINDELLAPIAEQFITLIKKEDYEIKQLDDVPGDYKTWGRKFIDSNTIHQMDLAMKLPCVEKGALMPDAHRGYGIPIGGVIATKNQVIPYAVGVDIGCRMALTIFEEPASYLFANKFNFKQTLMDQTHFGNRLNQNLTNDHEILENPNFNSTELLKKLRRKAQVQLGTSGSGNHFVEFGEVHLVDGNCFNLPSGNYLGLLSHSGSRGIGATVAEHYTKIAMSQCHLPKEVKQLAWLNMDSTEGMEYWISMNLAGDYAKACHEVIHDNISKALNLNPLLKVENHHNFAWHETDQSGQKWYVHRKGATPAHLGELGIIPTSMTSPGYVVSGKGNEQSLNSASHGSGRLMSRSRAKETFTKKMLKEELSKAGTLLIGGSIDEAPFVYKNGEDVIASQLDLVNVEGLFTPRIIRMDKD